MWSGAFARGLRVFDVAVGGVTDETGLDFLFDSGGPRAALVRSYAAVVEGGGGLAVTFTSNVPSAIVSAIEVHRWSAMDGDDDGAGDDIGASGDDGAGDSSGADGADGAGTDDRACNDDGADCEDGAVGDDAQISDDEGAPAAEVEENEPAAVSPATLRLNVGGHGVAGYTLDTPYVTNGPATRTWTSATEVSTAVPYATPAAIYATQQWGKEVAYTFLLLAGTYTLRLHFAELYRSVAVEGRRVFSIAARGRGDRVTLDNVDVFASARWATAYSRTLSVAVVGSGGLHLLLKSSVEHAMVQGIEAMDAAGASATPPVVTPVPPDAHDATGDPGGAPPRLLMTTFRTRSLTLSHRLW